MNSVQPLQLIDAQSNRLAIKTEETLNWCPLISIKRTAKVWPKLLANCRVVIDLQFWSSSILRSRVALSARSDRSVGNQRSISPNVVGRVLNGTRIPNQTITDWLAPTAHLHTGCCSVGEQMRFGRNLLWSRKNNEWRAGRVWCGVCKYRLTIECKIRQSYSRGRASEWDEPLLRHRLLGTRRMTK